MFKPLIYVFLPFMTLIKGAWKYKSFLLFLIMPSYSARKHTDNHSEFHSRYSSCYECIWYSVACWAIIALFGSVLSILIFAAVGATSAFVGNFFIKIALPMAGMVLLSALYESGRIIALEQEAEKAKEAKVIPTETKVEDPTVPSVGRNAWEHEINALKKALDEDEGRIKFWKWLAIGVLSVVVLAGAATGYMLHKGILVVEVDGVSLAQELEKAQAELERLQGELPALEDAKKKLDEMMEKAKEMVPPGILPPEKEKKDDF